MKLSSVPSSRVRPNRAGRAAVGLMALLAAVGLLVSGAVGWRLAAQETPEMDQTSLGKVKNFVVPDYYDPPNQNQMKYLMRGGEAQPQNDGKVLIKELQIETYNTNGKPQMVIRAPECTYDQPGQTASSSNRIEAASGDGRIFIKGEGYRWEKTNSIFVISNRVDTIIRQEPETVP